jgi:formylglycine-generating enzyme required for sulfatase activity
LPQKDLKSLFGKGHSSIQQALSSIIFGISSTSKNMSETYDVIPIYPRQCHTAQYFIEALSNLLLDDDIKLQMVEIPAGSFVMGAPEEEAESRDDERPQHEVNISTFCMGKYPITQTQWRIVAAMPQIERELKPYPSRFKGDNLPVEQVSWLEAVEFCTRLSVYTKREYRLPSEAEWEYACRAMPSPYGRESPKFDGASNYDGVILSSAIASAIGERKGQIYPSFHYGETITTDLVNYNGNYPYGEALKGRYRETTTVVGIFPPNAFGLCDMHGNVWEWCEDDWHDNYEGAPTDGSAWIDNDDLSQSKERRKLVHGGSWFSDAEDCRSAYRGTFYAGVQYDSLGFRVVCPLQ